MEHVEEEVGLELHAKRGELRLRETVLEPCGANLVLSGAPARIERGANKYDYGVFPKGDNDEKGIIRVEDVRQVCATGVTRVRERIERERVQKTGRDRLRERER